MSASTVPSRRRILQTISTVLALLLLFSGAATSLGLYSTRESGRAYQLMISPHTLLSWTLLPLLFFRVSNSTVREIRPRKLGYTLLILWLGWHLAMVPLLFGIDLSPLVSRIPIAAGVFFMMLYRVVFPAEGRQTTAGLDALCLAAIAASFAAVDALELSLPLLLALCGLAQPLTQLPRGIPTRLWVAGLLLVAAKSLVPISDVFWIAVLAAGSMILAFTRNTIADLPPRLRSGTVLLLLFFAQALFVLLYMGIQPSDVLLGETTMQSTFYHLVWPIPLLAWIQRQDIPRTTPFRVASAMVLVGYQVFVWCYFFLGLRGMPNRYWHYPAEFSLHFEIAALGGVLTILGIAVGVVGWMAKATNERSMNRE